MTQADRVHSTPPTNTPVDTTRRFETLKDAEDALMEQGFKLVPDTCNWIDDAARIDAGIQRKPMASRNTGSNTER